MSKREIRNESKSSNRGTKLREGYCRGPPTFSYVYFLMYLCCIYRYVVYCSELEQNQLRSAPFRESVGSDTCAQRSGKIARDAMVGIATLALTAITMTSPYEVRMPKVCRILSLLTLKLISCVSPHLANAKPTFRLAVGSKSIQLFFCRRWRRHVHLGPLEAIQTTLGKSWTT